MSERDDDDEAGQELSPEEIAKLAAWFGEAEVTDELAAEFEARADEAEAARTRAVAEALRGVDTGFTDRLWRREAAADMMSRAPSPIASRVDENLAAFDLAAWGLRFAGEPREYELADELLSDLGDRTPQALLRDLHRPENYFGTVAFTALDVGYDAGGVRSRALVLDAIHADYRAAMATDESLNPRLGMTRAIDEARAAITGPWDDLGKDRRPAVEGIEEDIMANAMKWFG